MSDGKSEKPRASWSVVPRAERKYLPDAMTPMTTIGGYDLIEYYDGAEVRRHEYVTRFEAETFKKIAEAEYRKHLEKREDPPSPWLIALVWAAVYIATIVFVRIAFMALGE